jgi:hypothetical protein
MMPSRSLVEAGGWRRGRRRSRRRRRGWLEARVAAAEAATGSRAVEAEGADGNSAVEVGADGRHRYWGGGGGYGGGSCWRYDSWGRLRNFCYRPYPLLNRSGIFLRPGLAFHSGSHRFRSAAHHTESGALSRTRSSSFRAMTAVPFDLMLPLRPAGGRFGKVGRQGRTKPAGLRRARRFRCADCKKGDQH